MPKKMNVRANHICLPKHLDGSTVAWRHDRVNIAGVIVVVRAYLIVELLRLLLLRAHAVDLGLFALTVVLRWGHAPRGRGSHGGIVAVVITVDDFLQFVREIAQDAHAVLDGFVVDFVERLKAGVDGMQQRRNESVAVAHLSPPGAVRR